MIRFLRRRSGRLGVVCQQVVELLDDYLDGGLNPEMRAALEAHLTGCDGCTAYLEQLRAAIALAARTGERALPTELEAELVAAFRRHS